MIKRTIYLATYYRGKYAVSGKTKPYHWLYFIPTPSTEGNEDLAITHQLRGMPRGFYYPGPEAFNMSEFGSHKEKLEVGEIDEQDMQSINSLLKTIQVMEDESSGWNCQDWALDGFGLLKEAGLVYEHLTREVVKAWLKEKD